MLKKSGFTEAEIAAAEFSQRFAEPTSTHSKKKYRERDQVLTEKWAERRNYREKKETRDRDSIYQDYQGNKDWDAEFMGCEKVIGRDKVAFGQDHSEFSRGRSRSQSKDRKHRCRRSCSRSPKVFRYPTAGRRERISRSRSRSRTRSRSRSDSRDRPRNANRESWDHDKWFRNISEKRSKSPSPKRVPQDYRPPSPTWVSRAGGVAIIKRKVHSN